MEKLELLNIILNEDNLIDQKKAIENYHPYEIALILQELEQVEVDKFYQIFDMKSLAIYFEHFEPKFGASQLLLIKPKNASIILEEMARDDASAILREINPLRRTKLINLMTKDASSELKQLLEYDEDEIGSITDPDFIQISRDMSVKEASKELVKQARDVDNIDYIYVLENNHLVGVLSLKELLISDKPLLINEVMNDNFQTLNAHDLKNSAVEIMQKYDVWSLPVIDDNNEMIGIVTVDDIMDIIEEETTEDFGKFAAISSGEIGDIDEKTFVSVKKRIPWLLCLLFIGIFTSSIIASFEETIATYAILAVFLPLVLDMSGNVGTQSLATTIRLLSSNQLDNSKEVKVHLLREFGIGVLNALAVSICVMIVTFIFQLIRSGYSFEIIKVSLIIAASMSTALICTNLVGAIIPILISKLKIDPATASGPFITTISDIFSLFIYFSLASLFLL